MRTLQALYDEAIRQNITIDYINIPTKQAFCVQDKKCLFIAIDKKKLKNEREEKQTLAEELSHCQYGYTYKIKDYTNPLYRQNIEKCEALTLRETAKKLVPLAYLQKARYCRMSIWEIAEELDIDSYLVEKAIEIYKLEKKI